MKNEKTKMVTTSQFGGLLNEAANRAYCTLHQDGPLTWKAVQLDVQVSLEYRGCRWHVAGQEIKVHPEMALIVELGTALRNALRQRRVELLAQAVQGEVQTPTWNHGTTWFIRHSQDGVSLQIDFEHATCRLGRSRKYIRDLRVDNLARLARSRLKHLLEDSQETQREEQASQLVATKKQGLILRLREAGVRSDDTRTIHVQDWSEKDGFVLSYLRKDRTLKAAFNAQDAQAAMCVIQGLDKI